MSEVTPGESRTIGRYRILSELGRGSRARVYLAIDPNIDRKVALKFLPEKLEGDAMARERFLREMDAVVPWSILLSLIEPHYPKAGNGRRPYPLGVMLRIYFLQQWYQLSDPGAEEALYDIQSMRAFADLELGRDAIPDETTILNFRHLLEVHDLTKAIFAAVSEHLEDKGAMLRGGTISM